MDRKLLDLLVSPDTRQPLTLLDSTGLQALNTAIAAGTVLRADGSAVDKPQREALITADRNHIYRVEDGIPVLLPEEAIASASIAGLSKA